MLVLPIGVIGVYTSFSKESILDLHSIQKLAVENGIKVVGISDSNYSLWIEELLLLPRTSVIFFPAVKTSVFLDNQKIRLYVWPRSLSALEYLGKKESLNLRDLKYLDTVVFYSGNDKKTFYSLYDLLPGKIGIAITKHNKNFVIEVLDKVDYVIPFHYSTIPKELESYYSILKKFIKNPSPFPSASYLIKELESISDKIATKLSYTIGKLEDIRDYFSSSDVNKDDFSTLLWNKIISLTKPDDNIRKEFTKIKDLGLSKFFYNLINSFEEFLSYGNVSSDILSTSFIFEKLKLIKINKFKKVSLFHLLDSKPFYLDIHVSSKEKFKEILHSNFGDNIFYRVYPVHLRKNVINDVLKNLPEKVKEFLESYLKNAISTFRVSNKIFYSSSILPKSIKRKDGILMKFCSRCYDVVLDVSRMDYLPSKSVYSKVIQVVREDKDFFTPNTVSVFLDDLREKYKVLGISDTFRFFYISKVLSLRPYYKTVIEELVSKKLPLFVEDISSSLDENIIEIVLEIIWSRDKKDVTVNEVDLFRILVEKNVDKNLSEEITKFIAKYKNVIGIKSFEIPKFYNFLAYAGLSIEDKKRFIVYLLRDSIVRSKKYHFIVLQKLIKRGYDICFDINNSSMMKVSEREGRFFLPFVCGRFNFKFIESVVKEREFRFFKNFSEFYARIGKDFPRETNKLAKMGAFDSIDDRKLILGLPLSLPSLQKDLTLVKEEFRTLGFSIYLFKSNFSYVRNKNNCISIEECISGRTNRVFGFISGIDKYGNVFLQDENSTIFVKNKTFVNLRVGDYGVFEIDVTDGFLGKNFFLRNVFKEILF